MSTEKAKHYLRHLEEFIELSDEDKDTYLDGFGGQLLDNDWYSMNDEERSYCEKEACAMNCKKYGHDDNAEDKLTYACVCGSKKPYKTEP